MTGHTIKLQEINGLLYAVSACISSNLIYFQKHVWKLGNYRNRNLFLELRSALFWDITQVTSVIFIDVPGKKTIVPIFKGFQGTS